MSQRQMYDSIANECQLSKQLPFRHYIERYTLFNLLGDLRGRTVLDLACGEGVYTRQFKRAGAKEVTGVDVSEGMIALAQAEERAEQMGCKYVCANAAEFTPDDPVDIVTAVYLWNYARTRAELLELCRACRRALRPGGRLVGINDNMRSPPHPGVGTALATYGFSRTCGFPPREGESILYRMVLPDSREFEFENYYLAPATYEEAARAAGLADFRWVDALLHPDESGNPFWSEFLRHAPLTAFTATRAP